VSALALLRAEWLKTRRRPMHWILLGLLASTGLIFTLFGGIRIVLDPAMRERARTFMPWPHILQLALTMLQFFGRVATITLTASIVGGEYGLDTWKMLLPRRPGRAAFLWTKLGISLVAVVLGILVVVVSFVIPGSLTARLLGIEPAGTVDLAALVWRYATFFLEVSFYVAVTVLASVVTRSTFGGILLGLGVMFFLDLVGDSTPLAALLLPAMHMDNLRAQLSGDSQLLDQVQMAFEDEISLGTSAAVWLGYVTALLTGAFIVFRRRDMAGGSGG
jgi:ABC-type transport system involved in multi-copper enzyme maturation permease subunit